MGLKFFTETGLEVPSVTTTQMIEVDRVAIEETGPNLFQMMENAGRNLALQAISNLGQYWQQANIVVLAGSGGNGGGGICAARHLANHGVNVKLCLSSNKLKDVPQWQRHIFQATNGAELTITELPLELIQWANATDAPILSLDIPSGVDSTTGETSGEYIEAQWTMTLALPKTGLLPQKTGALMLADIGIPPGTFEWETLRLDYFPPFGDRFRVPLRCEVIP